MFGSEYQGDITGDGPTTNAHNHNVLSKQQQTETMSRLQQELSANSLIHNTALNWTAADVSPSTRQFVFHVTIDHGHEVCIIYHNSGARATHSTNTKNEMTPHSQYAQQLMIEAEALHHGRQPTDFATNTFYRLSRTPRLPEKTPPQHNHNPDHPRDICQANNSTPTTAPPNTPKDLLTPRDAQDDLNTKINSRQSSLTALPSDRRYVDPKTPSTVSPSPATIPSTKQPK